MIYNAERPVNFDQMIGQELVVENIRNQSIRNEFFPVFILCGQYGSGKTTMARIISMAANCQDKDERGNPCGKCDSCLSVLNHSPEGIIEIDGASNNGVESVRKLLGQASTIGIYSKKIIVIDEAHMLSKAAFNALLITLENPPSHCIFILCTTEKEALPDTIVSRAPVYVFGKIPDELVKEHVLSVAKKNEITISDDAAGVLARYANGAMRNALQLLEHLSLQCLSGGTIEEKDVVCILGLSSMEQRAAFLDSCLASDIREVVNILRSCERTGRSIRTFIQDVLEMNTDLLMYRSGATIIGTKFYLDKLKELSAYQLADVVKANKMLSVIAATPVGLLSTERIAADIVATMYERVSVPVKDIKTSSEDCIDTKKDKKEDVIKDVKEVQEVKVALEEDAVKSSEEIQKETEELEAEGFVSVTDESQIPFEIEQTESKDEPVEADMDDMSALMDSFSLFGNGFFDSGMGSSTSKKKKKKQGESENLLEAMDIAGAPTVSIPQSENTPEEVVEAKAVDAGTKIQKTDSILDEDCKEEACIKEEPEDKLLKDSVPPNMDGRMNWDEAAELGIVRNRSELVLPKPETPEELKEMYDSMEEADDEEEIIKEPYASRSDLIRANEELAKLLKNPGFKILYNKAKVVEENNQIYLCFESQSLAVAMKIFLKDVEGIHIRVDSK